MTTAPTVQKVTVLGAGYVGLTTAALLAHAGYNVALVEPNTTRLAAIKAGRSFFFEAGLDPVIKAAIDNSSLTPTNSYAEAIPGSQLIFSCVGTPDNPDGSSNLTYVFSAAEETLRHIDNDVIFVQKSTVPVGTGERVKQIFATTKKSIAYVSNPEFLREGTALYDTLFFDRVVAGGENQTAIKAVLDVYRQLEKHRDAIAKLANVKGKDISSGQYISTSLASAELIKVTANAFLALKISFANSIAKLADKAGADIGEVMDAVGADTRIGRAFLNAGRGYGGGCFPKDVSGLIASGLEHGVDLEIMQAAQSVNQSMPGYVLEKLQGKLVELTDKRVAVLGLSFKAGTSDVRKSPGVAIANQLKKRGVQVAAYDPEAMEEATEDLAPTITLADSAEQALEHTDAVIIATEWPEFRSIDSTTLPPIVVDAVNVLSPSAIAATGRHYLGIGR